MPAWKASREAAGLYHSAAALETSAYGVAGVPAEAQPALLAASPLPLRRAEKKIFPFR